MVSRKLWQTREKVIYMEMQKRRTHCILFYSCPFRLSFHRQQLPPPWVWPPDPHFPAPSPPCNETHYSGWGGQGWGMDHVHSSYPVLPSTDHPLCSPSIPRISLSVSAYFPTMGVGIFLIGKISSHLQLPAREAGPFFDSCFPFFLFLASCEEIFLVLLGAWSLPLMFSRHSGTTVPFVDVLLIWGGQNILWHCLSLGMEWKLTFSSPMATAGFSKFAGILSAAHSQHHLLGFETAQLEIPSPLLALFVVMLPKAHLTLHSRISGSKVITPSWLSGSWRKIPFFFL